VASGPDGGFDEGEKVSEHDLRQDYDDEPQRPRSTAASVLRQASDLIRWCGQFQLTVSILGIMLILGTLVESWLNGRRLALWDEMAAYVVVPLSVAGIVLTPIALIGSTAMRKRTQYSLASAACAITILSLPCFVVAPFAIPLGIWGLMVLNRADVRESFECQAAQTADLSKAKR
jgi:hypothetical protein